MCDTAFSVPPEIWIKILENLAFYDFSNATLTCHQFKDLSLSKHFACYSIPYETRICLRLIQQLQEVVSLIDYTLNNKVRLALLENSLSQLGNALRQLQMEISNHRLIELMKYGQERWDCFKQILYRINQTIREALDYFNEVRDGKLLVNQNSDIFDLILVRYNHQLISLIENPDASSCLKDKQAADFWRVSLNNAYYVSFNEFKEAAKCIFICNDELHEDFWECVKFLLNFPRDNVVTAYKFHILVSQFGPLNHMVSCIVKYCIKEGGFVGYINLYGAKEILDKHGVDKYIIRHSRNEPTQLTISFHKNRNVRKSEDIPLSQVIKTLNLGQPAKERISLKSLSLKENLIEYASESSMYICQDPEEELCEDECYNVNSVF